MAVLGNKSVVVKCAAAMFFRTVDYNGAFEPILKAELIVTKLRSVKPTTAATATTLFNILVYFTGIHSPHIEELIEAGCVT